MPSHLFELHPLFTVDQDLHPVVEKTLAFEEVEHVELDPLTFASVLDSEVEPLSVALRIDIVLQN
jgi:hypothetical protein